MQHVQLRPASICGTQSRMRPSQSSRRPICCKCQQYDSINPKENESRKVLVEFGQKMAAVTAAALLMVIPFACDWHVPFSACAQLTFLAVRLNQLAPDQARSSLTQPERLNKSLKRSSRAGVASHRSVSLASSKLQQPGCPICLLYCRLIHQRWLTKAALHQVHEMISPRSSSFLRLLANPAGQH